MRVEAFGTTDIGLARRGNEDSYAVLPDLGLFMVADGVGGGAAGDVASRMAIDIVSEAFENREMTWPMAAGAEHRSPGARLLNAGLQRANTRIRGLASCELDKAGMGTTFAGILAVADRLVIAHVGDSRVYRLRGRRLDLLTEDHSLLNAFVRAGLWNPDEGQPFPHPNVITRAIGGEDTLDVELRVDVPARGDVYLICSDGLHGMVDDREIASVLLKHDDLTQAAFRLIELANDNGGLDNITVVLLRVVGSAARP
jgi:protein phosphatase